MNGPVQIQLARLMSRARDHRRELSRHRPGPRCYDYVSAWGGTSNLSERADARREHAATLAAARTLRELREEHAGIVWQTVEEIPAHFEDDRQFRHPEDM